MWSKLVVFSLALANAWSGLATPVSRDAELTCPANSHANTPPGFTFLYTANATISDGIDFGVSPFSHRIVYPITGGHFCGPKINGTFLNLGADWGINDANGIFHPDTRYHMKTSDGANIYIQTDGPTQPDGRTILRIRFETGHPNYYWLNNIVAIGILYGPDDANYVLIDAWQVELPTWT